VRLLDCVDEQLAAVDADCAEYSRALEQLTSAPMASSVGQQHKRHMTLLQVGVCARSSTCVPCFS
jgi:hypothetical protein